MTTIFHIVVTPHASDKERLQAIYEVSEHADMDDAEVQTFICKVSRGSSREILFTDQCFDSLEQAEEYQEIIGEPYEVKSMVFGEAGG